MHPKLPDGIWAFFSPIRRRSRLGRKSAAENGV